MTYIPSRVQDRVKAAWSIDPSAYFIYSEDLCAGITGPFSSVIAAWAHIEFMRHRGDASVLYHENTLEILQRDAALLKMRDLGYLNLVSPEEDMMANW